MDCQAIEREIQLYVDGELPPERVEALCKHMATCSSCALAYKEAQEFHDFLFANIEEVTPPAHFAADVMAKIEALPQEAEKAVVIPLAEPAKKTAFAGWSRFGVLGSAAVIALAVYLSGTDLPSLNNYPLPSISFMAEEPVEPVSDPVDPQPSGQDPADVTVPAEENDKTNPDSNSDRPQQRENDGQNPSSGGLVTPQNPSTENPGVTGNQPEPTQNGELSLPQVASGRTVEGTFNLLLLAAHKNADAYEPQFDSTGAYAYYKVGMPEGVQNWKTNVSPNSDPSKTEDSYTFVNAKTTNAVADWLDDTPYLAALSPDSGMLAANMQSEDGGLWIFSAGSEQKPQKLSDIGGGSLLLWSPDGSKILFTDQNEALYVAFPTENIIMPIIDGKVKDVSWSSNSHAILFSWLREDSKHWAIYTAVLP